MVGDQPSISSSSTFKRLPSLAKTPFRREKTSTLSTTTPPSDHIRSTPLSEHLLPSLSSLTTTTSFDDAAAPMLGSTRMLLQNPHTAVRAHPAYDGPDDRSRQREHTMGAPLLSKEHRSEPSITAERGDETRSRKTTLSKVDVDSGRARKASNRHHAEPLRPRLPTSKLVTEAAPASNMYFSLVPCHGIPPGQPLRAHTGSLLGEKIWFMGGVDSKHCWRKMAWFDTETLLWSTIETFGEQLPPLRAHTANAVGNDLLIFGGGDGPTYSNEVWLFDTNSHRFHKPRVLNSPETLPPPRRAHTAVCYNGHLVIFGGGNGQAALNDVWALDLSDPKGLVWREWLTTGDVPQKKGYHTANLVGDKMVIFGGSDGHASFADVHILNLETLVWTLIDTEVRYNRLSHTSTLVGSYLFVIGGHDGQDYAQDVLLFNLVTLQWETKTPRGIAPPGRGYHVAVLHDARIYLSGGYNGINVFDDLWALDLSAGAYLPQVTTFEIDETSARKG